MSLPTSPIPQAILEVGANTVGCLRLSLPRRLTLKSSTSTLADGNHSPYNGDLLTPPLTNPSLDEPPFRPADSDRTSLSMKRRHGSSHQRRRRHNRACGSSGDVDQTALFGKSPKHILSLSRSKSAPSLADLLLAARGPNETSSKCNLRNNINTTQEAELASRRNSLPAHRRRWTIPGKARPTRVLTSMSPSAVLPKQHDSPLEGEPSNDRIKSIETPAIITLQRAASSQSRRTSLRPGAYTSFPTPTFSKTKSGFVNTFWGDGWQRLDTTITCASIRSASIAVHHDRPPSSSGRASVDQDNVRPSQSTTASPVCTDVVLTPYIQEETIETQPAFRARRCSTKYVSGSSTYEIIWDENVSTSSSSGSRRTSTEQGRRISMRDNETEPNRRFSVAIDKLEMQLSRGFEQCIKKSSASRGLGAGRSTSATCPSTNRMSFHNVLSLQQAESDAVEESQGFAHSRASTTSKPKLSGHDMEVDLTTVTDDETSTRHMDFFPPLSSNHSGFHVPEDPLLANPWRTSWETRNDTALALPNPASAQRRGSMIGQSTGVRKKSVYIQSPTRLARKTGSTRRRHKSTGRDEEDRKPLLGQFNNWSNETVL